MTRARRIAAPALGVFASIALSIATRGFDHVTRGGQLGPGFWPRLVLVGLGLACLLKLAAGLRDPRIEEGFAASASVPRGKLAAAIAAIVGYVLATPAIGFPLAT